MLSLHKLTGTDGQTDREKQVSIGRSCGGPTYTKSQNFGFPHSLRFLMYNGWDIYIF